MSTMFLIGDRVTKFQCIICRVEFLRFDINFIRKYIIQRDKLWFFMGLDLFKYIPHILEFFISEITVFYG